MKLEIQQGDYMDNVLVVQLARFGDIIQTKRLMLTLQAEANVHICVDESMKDITSFVYPFAQIHTIPAHASDGRSSFGFDSLFHSIKKSLGELSSYNFSAVYTLNTSPLTTAIASLFPPEIVHGFFVSDRQAMSDQWCKIASRISVNRNLSPLNIVDYWAFFHPSPIAPEKVNPIARRQGTETVGIVMSGRQSRRSLPIEVLSECMQAIFRSLGGVSFICFGSKSERPLVRQLLRLLPATIISRLNDTTGRTILADLPDLLKQCDMVVTPDTGIMHLCAHLGIPVQAFFLSSAWCFETGPYGTGHTVWQSITHCSPCLESAKCIDSLKCLNPFTDKNFLMHLSGKPALFWPKGLCGFVSSFDDFGAFYKIVDGMDPYSKERFDLRSLLHEYTSGTFKTGIPTSVAEQLFRERDWMLPARI